MYINREPLGQGNLTFGRRRRRFPYWRLIIYLAILAAALYVYLRIDYYRPRVLAYIGPAPTPTPSAPQQVDRAYQAYREGDLETAIVYYHEAVTLDPTNVDYRFELARLLIFTGQLEEALAVAEQAILAAPESPQGYAIKAMALDWMGEPDEAVVTALRALEIDPYYAPTRAYLAEAYADLGRWVQAREQAELAIELDPFSVDARRNYAYVLEYVGDYEGAVQQYLQAIQLHPNLLHLWYGLARNYRGAGQYEQSIATYAEIRDRTPEDPQIYTELGQTYFLIREDAPAQENLEQAVELVRQQNETALEQDPQADTYIYVPAWTRLGMVYFTRRNYEDAIVIFEELVAWGEEHGVPVPVEAYYVPGVAYFYLDECDRGVPLLFEALALNEEGTDDPVVTDNVLRGLLLCRDFAETPVTVQWPEGYSEPDVGEIFLSLPGAPVDETGDDE